MYPVLHISKCESYTVSTLEKRYHSIYYVKKYFGEVWNMFLHCPFLICTDFFCVQHFYPLYSCYFLWVMLLCCTQGSFLSLLYIFINTFFVFLSLKASLSPSYQLQTFTTSGELFPPVAQLRNLSMRQALTLCLLTTCTFSIGDCPRVPRKPFGLGIFTTVKVTRGT